MKAVRQELSCALCRDEACISDRSLLALARGVERGFKPGWERTVDEAGYV